MRKNERTLKMMEEYVELHNAGLAPKEIADKFSLAPWTVYNHLQEIADKAGVSRESLLKVPHEKPVAYERQFEPVEPIDTEELHRKFLSALESIDVAGELVKETIEAEEKFENEVERRVAEWN